MLLDGCVAALKLNPVNEYVGASLERALQPLIARGVLVLFYGGGEARARGGSGEWRHLAPPRAARPGSPALLAPSAEGERNPPSSNLDTRGPIPPRAQVGKALVESPLVDSVHMTGSEKTFDAVVWQGRPKARPPRRLFPRSPSLPSARPRAAAPANAPRRTGSRATHERPTSYPSPRARVTQLTRRRGRRRWTSRSPRSSAA